MRAALLAALLLFSCARPPAQSLPFALGFWFWEGSSADLDQPPVDLLYVQVGTIRRNTPVHVHLPTRLPKAAAYWAVLRFDGTGIPSPDCIPALVEAIAELQKKAPLAGLQLDIDCPTRSLDQYAKLLHQVKAALPPGLQLSITALLDWFRPNTAIASVIREVDEFTPQFYDIQDPNLHRPESIIAAPFNAAKWGPVFQRFEKPFRIGISTFGRARFIKGPSTDRSYVIFADVRPLDIGLNPAFALTTSTTPARELVLHYEATQPTKVSYTHFEAGSGIDFILATPESIQTAVAQARRLGGYCAGVLFFRWPAQNESLTASPSEVLGGPLPPASIQSVDGHCAAVSCVDLYLRDAPRLNTQPLRYQVRGTIDFQYFLPAARSPARLSGPSQLDVVVPPYCGRSSVLLGRAVSSQPSRFTLQ